MTARATGKPDGGATREAKVAASLAAESATLASRLGPVVGITADSRAVAPQMAFAAYPGIAHDGRAFIGDAIARGAASVLYEASGFDWDLGWRIPHVAVAGLKARIGGVAAAIYGRPSQNLWMVGVTGTNGKTSCAHWSAQALAHCGRRSAIVGTLGNGPIGRLVPTSNTTPDACVLQAMLAGWRAAGTEAVAMEVSSHGIDQGRVNGIDFDVALFTNLTRDHLDYHETLQAYGETKARLLEWPALRTAVINAADDFGRTLIERTRARGRDVVAYGAAGADVVATGVQSLPSGMAVDVETTRGHGRFVAPVSGAFNVQNLLGVLGVLLASDIELHAALDALAHVAPPPGRMERLGGGAQPLVIVDYAHTPDALGQVLQAMRPFVAAGGKLVCVFGCGGNRDRGKRTQMGAVAARLADRIVVTNDNPRDEEPRAIADDIVAGARPIAADWTVELDRASAIELALDGTHAGDVVILAGKGDEDYQEANGRRVPFSDRAVVSNSLARRDRA